MGWEDLLRVEKATTATISDDLRLANRLAEATVNRS
jgi:hypothetical protein